jgi:type III secretory pathway component EscU
MAPQKPFFRLWSVHNTLQLILAWMKSHRFRGLICYIDKYFMQKMWRNGSTVRHVICRRVLVTILVTVITKVTPLCHLVTQFVDFTAEMHQLYFLRMALRRLKHTGENIVLLKWCFSYICVHSSVFVWYNDISTRIWKRSRDFLVGSNNL